MNTMCIAVLFMLFLGGCQAKPQEEARVEENKVMFLTRKGCPHSPVVYRSLVSVLTARGISEEPVTIYLGLLAEDDARTGYGTPTILVNGHDLFGLGVPAPAPPT